jgi:hypothetical protein
MFTLLNTYYWVGGVAEDVECLPCKCEALSSNPSTAAKEKTKQNKNKLLGLKTGQMSEYPIPPWRALHSCFLRRSCKTAFLHPEEEIQVLIDLPQG